LLDEHRLADAGAAEQTDLAALDVRREQVDRLDAGLEHHRRGLELVEVRGLAVDGPALGDLELFGGLVQRVADHVEDGAEGDVADGHRDRGAGVSHGLAADHAVGGLQRDAAHHPVTEVLGGLEGQGRGLEAGAGVLDLDGERVVELGDVPGRELDVDDGAGDAGDASGGTGRLGGGGLAGSGGGHVRSLHVVPTRGAVGLCQRSVRPDPERASAPPTISVISWVISAWRAEFASRVNLLICVSALSVADFIARCVEACSEAIACSRMLMIRDSTYRGSSSAMTVSASGVNSYSG